MIWGIANVAAAVINMILLLVGSSPDAFPVLLFMIFINSFVGGVSIGCYLMERSMTSTRNERGQA